MKTVTINGKSHPCPLTDRFRRHSDEERAAMRESVWAAGVLNHVRLYDDTDLGLAGCVLDGEGRSEVAAEVGADVPVVHMGEMGTEAAYEVAKALNDARRHDDPEAIRRRREERVKRVAEKRAEGKSLRGIAEEEGVSLGQVQRDLEAGTSGVSGDTPEPAKVTGRDGKIYPVAPKPIDYPPTVEDAPAEPDDVEPVYGEAWDPEDGNDTEFDFGANAPAGPVDEPVPEAEPPPAGSPRKKLPSHFKPGNNADPDHPFANILAALTHTTGLITRALNTPEGEKLRAYLSPLAAVPIPIKHVDFSSDVIKGDEYVAGKCRFVGHRALRHLVHLAGLPGRVKAPDAVLDAYRKTALTGDDQ